MEYTKKWCISDNACRRPLPSRCWDSPVLTFHPPAKAGEESTAQNPCAHPEPVLQGWNNITALCPSILLLALCAHVPASCRGHKSMLCLPVSASSPVIKGEQGLGDLTTQKGYDWAQYIPKLIHHFRAAFPVLQQVFSTLTSISTIVANAKVDFAFSAAIFCFTLLSSFNDCRDIRCSSTFITSKAPSPQLAPNLPVVPAATAVQGRFSSFWTRVLWIIDGKDSHTIFSRFSYLQPV